MQRHALWTTFALAGLLSACSGDDDGGLDAGGPGGDDAGLAQDGGVEEDAGGEADSGALVDGGVEADGGADADGGAEIDAGTSTSGPIEAPAETWTWVDFPDSRCLNDTPTGIGVNIAPGATRVLIYLQGGGACFNGSTCATAANTNGYNAGRFESQVVNSNYPIFDRGAAENLFAADSWVFVPYCTGDVHAGSNPEGMVGNNALVFAGFTNMTEYLDRLVPTFEGVTEVVLAGSSAGGFGAMLNFEQVQTAFGPDVQVTLLDDSGPVMDEAFTAPCLQDHFRTLWGFDEGVLANCEACAASPDGWIRPYFEEVTDTWSDRTFMVISSDADQVIRQFWGFGQDDCANLGAVFPPAYSASMFRMGLEDFRDDVALGRDNVGLFLFENSNRHVWLIPNPYWTIEQDNVNLADWIELGLTADPRFGHIPPPAGE